MDIYPARTPPGSGAGVLPCSADGALHAALEHALEALNRVRVDIADHVFARAVVNASSIARARAERSE